MGKALTKLKEKNDVIYEALQYGVIKSEHKEVIELYEIPENQLESQLIEESQQLKNLYKKKKLTFLMN